MMTTGQPCRLVVGMMETRTTKPWRDQQRECYRPLQLLWKVVPVTPDESLRAGRVMKLDNAGVKATTGMQVARRGDVEGRRTGPSPTPKPK